MKNLTLSGIVVALLLLAACGGGSGSGGGSTPNLSVSNTSVTEGDSGTANLTFTVSLSAPASGNVTVDYATSDGTATAGSDYTANNGTLTISAGNTSGTVTVSVTGDTDIESNETLTLTLSNPAGATIATASATGTINDDDSVTPPTVSPLAGTTGVDVNTSITAVFSEAMDASTITSSTFTLSNNAPVSGTITYNSGTNTATFTPDANLDYLTTYTATLTTGVAGLSGNNLASDFIWSFTSGSTIGSAVQLPETGQTTCYDAAGNVINCPNTGQDGDILAGISWPTPRFTDNGDGTVADNLTGLLWLKNANCFGGSQWTLALSNANSLASGSCGLSDGSNAGDWRLPNVNELESLVNTEEANQATWLVSQSFTDVQADNYWSSTTYALNTSSAMRVNMLEGRLAAGDKGCGLCNVWPVRAGQ